MRRACTRILALAGVTLAGAATAQIVPNGGAPITSSSVNLFGVVDLALAYGQGDISDRTRLATSGYNSSRIGFRGDEDLGGGLGVNFWLEAGVNPDDGSGSATNVNNQAADSAPTGTQGLTFNRRSTVSFVSGWGELRLGRDYTSTFRNRDHTDPFGTNGVGQTQVNASTISGVTGTRASNMIAYFLPTASLGGVFGEAQYYLGENPSNTANAHDGEGYQARLGYASKVWGLAAAYGLTKYATSATQGDIEVWNVGGHFDFGLARVTAGYFEEKVKRTASLTGTGYTVGAVFPVGANVVKVAYSNYGTDASGDPRTNKLALGYVHNLSKRTAAYVTYAHVENHGPATSSLNSSQTGAGGSSDGFDVGLKHSF